MHEDRKPNWEKWRHVPNTKIWEAVALSLNIDPWEVRPASGRIPGGPLIFDEGQEFNDRIFVVDRNLATGAGPTPQIAAVDDPPSCVVSLCEFATWAHSLGWDVPLEFAALLRAEQDGVRDEAEVKAKIVMPKVAKEKPLGTRERDTLRTIIAALANAAKTDLSKPFKAAGQIEAMTIKIGARVSARAIENHLKGISDARERALNSDS
jgi:hypothetical protein